MSLNSKRDLFGAGYGILLLLPLHAAAQCGWTVLTILGRSCHPPCTRKGVTCARASSNKSEQKRREGVWGGDAEAQPAPTSITLVHRSPRAPETARACRGPLCWEQAAPRVRRGPR
jgi:hypothetical protein